MERLTEFHGGIWGMSVKAVENGYDRYSVFSRLAEYENIGISPRQLYEIDELYGELAKELAEYKKAEKDGRLIKSPCKIGDTVYVLAECGCIGKQLDGTMYGKDGGLGTATGYYCPYEDACPHMDSENDCEGCKDITAIFEDEICMISIDKDCGIIVYTENCNVGGTVGEYVFLSREAAEAALAEMEGENEK